MRITQGRSRSGKAVLAHEGVKKKKIKADPAERPQVAVLPRSQGRWWAQARGVGQRELHRSAPSPTRSRSAPSVRWPTTSDRLRSTGMEWSRRPTRPRTSPMGVRRWSQRAPRDRAQEPELRALDYNGSVAPRFPEPVQGTEFPSGPGAILTCAGWPRPRSERPHTAGPELRIGGNWRVIASQRRPQHLRSRRPDALQCVPRRLPRPRVPDCRHDPQPRPGRRLDSPREPAELYWEQLDGAGLTMAPLEQH